ncbi:phospholipase [Aureococcus anophagefferens]|nr:phospholipase [Aureococcus anophagefferens]
MSHRDSRGESFLLKRASAPKILLEVLSPGGTRLLFLVMYASCALAIWRYNSARTAAEARHEARASVAVEPLGDGVPASVGSRAVWHARLSSLGALFGTTALTVQYPNATVNATTDDDAALRHLVSYAVTVEASRDGYERASGRWSSVLERRRETCEVAYASPGDGVAVLPTALASWYQNMEAAPSRSGVRSLQVWVDFCLPVDAAAYDGACHVVQPEVAKLLAAGGPVPRDVQRRPAAAAAPPAAAQLVPRRARRVLRLRSPLAMRFPTLWGVDRAPTLALASWPVDALRAFVACSLGIVLAMFLWGALFAFLLAGDRLNRTPYVLSRRHQLSYRYFMLQATLVAGIGVASYYHLGVELFHGYRRNLLVLAKGQRHNEVQFTSALQDLAGALEALVADDVRDLASAFCFTVYVALILYLHLPPPAAVRARFERSRPSVAAQLLPRQVLEDLGELGNLSGVLVGARFAVDERADRKRRRQIRKRTGRAAEPVFVVETASWLAKVSVESYYDVAPKGDADAGTARLPARGLARSVAGGGGGRAAAGPLHAALHAAGAAPAVRDARAEADAAEDGDLDDDDDEAGASREAKGPMDWFLRSAAVLFGGVERGVFRRRAQVAAADLATHCLPQRRKQTRLSCYTFGSPRVGNHIWARTFDALVPDAYRVVADGDVVPAVPRCCFRHGGTPVVVDPKARAAGFLIVDPSFIEQSLALSYSRKLAPHKLAGYVGGGLRPEAEVREIDRARYKAAAGAAPAKTASFLDGVPLEAPDANMPRRYARDALDSESI